MESNYYFWVRIFDYNYEKDKNEKGILLDEYYITLNENDRDQAKNRVKEKSNIVRYSKPKKQNGKYAIIMESSKYWHDRFYDEIDTYCHFCKRPIKGKLRYFKKEVIYYNDKEDELHYYCSYDCKYKKQSIERYEGEFQEKETMTNIAGFIYHIYNRNENKHYVGQTRFLPFFRWQEHTKNGSKGDIEDLIFETIAKVPGNGSIEGNRIRLDELEQWWINKFVLEYGKENVFNIQIKSINNMDQNILDL